MFINFSIFLRRKINLLLIITSTCLGSLIFLNADKLIFEVETNNINVKNLISTRIGLLIFAFFFISLVLYALNVSGIKKFSESSIEQYISWFFTALGVAANWMFYRFSIDLYTALKQNLHIDTLYRGIFVTVKRVWNKNELLDILDDELLKCKEIIFSNEEKANLINKAETSVESLISEMHILCEIKQSELMQVQPKNMAYRIIDYVSTHPAEIVLVGLVIAVACIGFQNYFLQTNSESIITHLLSEVRQLRGEINHIEALRETINIISSHNLPGLVAIDYENFNSRLDDIVDKVDKLAGNDINNTKALSMVIHILRNANLWVV